MAHLRIAVFGAGAVGSYYGAMLARAGHSVSLIGRPAHCAAFQQHGVRLQTADSDACYPVTAATDAAAVAEADWVFLCVKSADTEAAGHAMAPHLGPNCGLLCLQNGVDNAARLRAVVPQHAVASAVVYVATEMVGPGHVRHHGRGELLLESTAATRALAPLLQAAGIPVALSENALGALWMKLILNCAYNALSAITQLPYGPLVTSVGVVDTMRDVVAECLQVAQAEGVQLDGDIDAAVSRIAESMPTQFSSTAQDLARGKPSEIDYLNGLVVRRGAHWGIATPANRALWALVKALESQHRPVA